MSNLVKGTVDKVGHKDGQTKKGKAWFLDSFMVDGKWFGCGFNVKFPFSKGDSIKFSWDLDDRDNKLVDMDSLETFEAASGGSDGGGGEDKDIYWAKKDVRSRIGYARAAAIDLVKLSLEKDILPWTKAAKSADKFDLLMAQVDKVTQHFYDGTESQIAIIFDEADPDDDLPTDVVVGGDDDGDDLDD